MASAVPPAEIPAAHTSSQQWQSFEMRMRQRRIDRLLLRAQIAHEAGRDDEARAALAEAEQLNGYGLSLFDLPAPPANPTEDLLDLSNLPAPPPQATEILLTADVPWTETAFEIDPEFEPQIQSETDPRTHAWKPRVAGLLTVIVAVGWFATRISDPPLANQARMTPPRMVLREKTAPMPEPAEELPAVRLAVTDVAASNPVSEPIGPQQQEAISFEGRQVPASHSLDPSMPNALTSRSDHAALPAVARIDNSPPASPPPALPVSNTVPVEPTAPPAIPAAPPAAAPSFSPSPSPRVSAPAYDANAGGGLSAVDDAAVRAALARYESAYSRLDAEAASAVWPGLDRKALARAFGGLAAQSVSLGSCDVRLLGEVAVAECAGTATWTPKVGGGTHSQPRRWQFRLRNGSNGWQIVGATVR